MDAAEADALWRGDPANAALCSTTEEWLSLWMEETTDDPLVCSSVLRPVAYFVVPVLEPQLMAGGETGSTRDADVRDIHAAVPTMGSGVPWAALVYECPDDPPGYITLRRLASMLCGPDDQVLAAVITSAVTVLARLHAISFARGKDSFQRRLLHGNISEDTIWVLLLPKALELLQNGSHGGTAAAIPEVFSHEDLVHVVLGAPSVPLLFGQKHRQTAEDDGCDENSSGAASSLEAVTQRLDCDMLGAACVRILDAEGFFGAASTAAGAVTSDLPPWTPNHIIEWIQELFQDSRDALLINE